MANEPVGKKTCFVVMGFGEKIDFASNPQRVLDLNRTFEDIIEPTVTECGVECVRADKIIHSSLIDKPMYENLLEADLVVADLSTSNANAIYELGVRHALRPHTTIVMADQGFAFPFDLSHLSILKYEHMGKGILFPEVMRVRGALKEKIRALLDNPETDSPVYLFLPKLLKQDSPPPPAPPSEVRDEQSFADLMKSLRAAKDSVKNAADWSKVIDVLRRLIKLQPDDPHIIQQFALATYKSKQPDSLMALVEAKKILGPLMPETSSDSETVGIWGAIHKRLWELARQPDDLAKAIRAYARGYFIRNDYYNGINFAFLLNERAAKAQGDEAIADRVLARRIRGEVLELCDAALAMESTKPDEVFWIKATKVEALLGLGRTAESDDLKRALISSPLPTYDPMRGTQPGERPLPPAQWMIETMNDQLAKLAALKP